MSRTPSQAGAGGAGGASPQRPAAYPATKSAAPPASPSTATSSAAPAGAAAYPKSTAPASKPAAPPATPSTPPAAGGKSVSGPVAKPAKPHLFSKRSLIAGGSALGALVLLIALLVWRPWSPAPPRLNEQPYKIAKFAASSAMDRLPWAQQREYMDILADKDEALILAYKEGKLSDQEYRRALQLGWYDKHLDRMEKYFNRPPMMRTQYIDEKVLGKKIKKSNKEHGGATMPVPGKKPKPPKDTQKSDDLSPLKPEEIDRDNSTEEQDIKKWPADVRTRWIDYRTALAARKDFFKELERQEKEKRKSAAEASATKAGATSGSAPSDASTSTPTPAAPPADKAAEAQ